MFKCKHQWQKVAASYAPPVLDQLRQSGFSATLPNDLMNKILFGVTSIEYQCACGAHYTATLLGK
jgi:hypothetical protein